MSLGCYPREYDGGEAMIDEAHERLDGSERGNNKWFVEFDCKENLKY